MSLGIALLSLVLGMVALCWGYNVARQWQGTLKLYNGLPLRAAFKEWLAFNYRQRIFWIVLNAPGPMSLLALGMAATSVSASESLDSWFAFGIFLACLATLHMMMAALPPGILLVVPRDEAARLERALKHRSWIKVITIAPRSLTAAFYDFTAHAKWRSLLLAAWSEPVDQKRPFGAHSILRLVDAVPLAIVDTRDNRALLFEEVAWMMAPRRIGKALLLVADDSEPKIIKAIMPPGCRPADLGAQLISAGALMRLIEDLPDNLSYRSGALASKSMPPASREALSRARTLMLEWSAHIPSFLSRVGRSAGPDRIFDAELADWERAHDLQAGAEAVEPPHYSSSVQAVLGLIHRWLPDSSMTIAIDTAGRTRFELGTQESGNWTIFKSDDDGLLDTPRAALQAFLRAMRELTNGPLHTNGA